MIERYGRSVPFTRIERVILYFLAINWVWDVVADLASKITH